MWKLFVLALVVVFEYSDTQHISIIFKHLISLNEQLQEQFVDELKYKFEMHAQCAPELVLSRFHFVALSSSRTGFHLCGAVSKLSKSKRKV